MLRRNAVLAAAVMMGGVFLAALVSFLDGVITLAGRYIPQDNIVPDYFVGLVWAFAIAASIPVWPVRGSDKGPLLLSWLAKTLVTLGFMLLYEYRYDIDAYGYFEYSRLEDVSWRSLSWGGGTANIGYLAWLHNQLIPDSYHALKVSFALIGLLGVYLIYRAAVMYLRREERRILYALALFPSVLFWSSTIGKDPVMLFGIALYVYGVVGCCRVGSFRFLLALALGLTLTFSIRTWLCPILLAPLVLFALRGLRGLWPRLALLGLVLAAGLAAWRPLSVQFRIESRQDIVAYSGAMSGAWAQGGGPSGPWSLASLPWGAFTALFRPLPGEVMNLFGWMAGAENIVLLALLLQAVRRTRLGELRDPLLLWAVSLVLAWSLVYSFVSSMNLGAAVRFKLQILPVLLLLLFHCGRRREIPLPRMEDA